ncbi:DUF397 domain-containing protein [Nocardia tengchongensis]|uniref:DUF397 domain-containing protein n=1 Tax=Nocardia tengchongensis TaxID=2055889 RepID=UPI00367D325C
MNNELPVTNWFKSTYGQAQGECVEVAFLDSGRVGVRDSKNPTGPAREWDAFTMGVKDGEFDRP